MNAIKVANLTLRFALELAALAALGYWGFTLDQPLWVRVVAAIAAPLLAATIWGTFVSPKATRRLVDPSRFGVEMLIFGAASLALWVAGQTNFALALILLYLFNRALIVLLGQQAH